MPGSPEWHHRAACRGCDPDLFFPAAGQPATEARAICATCPVIEPCYDAGRNEYYGVWGGTTRKERQMAEKGGLTGRPPTRGCWMCGMPVEHRHRYCGDECRAMARRASNRRYNQRQQWEAS